MTGPYLENARTHDCAACGYVQGEQLPQGALRLADMGYFKLDTFKLLDERNVYWLTRFQSGSRLYDLQGNALDLGQYLAKQAPEVGDGIDIEVLMGAKHKLKCRLLCERVPQCVADERRRRLYEGARRRGQGVSRSGLALADWTLFVTNVPAQKLRLEEALVLSRARWQIELLFKLWKQHGLVDEWRSTKSWRILCEVYAKLIGLVIGHWLIVMGCWHNAGRSMVKALQTIRGHALHMASVLNRAKEWLEYALEVVCMCLDVGGGCSLNARKTAPNTYQLLSVFPTEVLA